MTIYRPQPTQFASALRIQLSRHTHSRRERLISNSSRRDIADSYCKTWSHNNAPSDIYTIKLTLDFWRQNTKLRMSCINLLERTWPRPETWILFRLKTRPQDETELMSIRHGKFHIVSNFATRDMASVSSQDEAELMSIRHRKKTDFISRLLLIPRAGLKLNTYTSCPIVPTER